MFDNVSSLWLLFSSGFLSATLLPGGSEAIFLYLANTQAHDLMLLILVVTLGNTLGGMTNYLLGRFIPEKTLNTKYSKKAVYYLNKYGYISLLFSWLPVIGDPLCLMAGWLRFNPIISFILIGLGKLLRYIVLAMIILNII